MLQLTAMARLFVKMPVLHILAWTLICAAGILLSALNCRAQTDPLDPEFAWHEVQPGYHVGRYALTSAGIVLKSEVLLLKFDPRKFQFLIVRAEDFGSPLADLQTLTAQVQGLAGINAHFFGTNSKPLGLLIQNGKIVNRLQRGGSLLTGVFMLTENTPSIVDRTQITAPSGDIALQSGPLLVAEGAPIAITQPEAVSRRSGVAITRSGHVIIFATLLRFPGASLPQIQQMLLDPKLGVSAALNLDGGGSSQLFVKRNIALADDTFISGGDLVPTGLVVKKK